MKHISTFNNVDRTRMSKVSFVDEQTYVVQFYTGYTDSKLVSYAYYDTLEHAEQAADEYVVELN